MTMAVMQRSRPVDVTVVRMMACLDACFRDAEFDGRVL